jgi:hypothetical protein
MPDPAGSLRRSHPPASQAPADHPPAAGVNPDASLFYRAPGSGLVERRGGVAPMDHFGSAVRPTGPPGAEPAARNRRRNRFGRGRSSYRSRPACGSPRRGTAAPTPPRHATPTRRVDERHDCQDIGSAYVPGTVWGTASSLTAKFRSRRRACLSKSQILPTTAVVSACGHPCRRALATAPGHTSLAKPSEPLAKLCRVSVGIIHDRYDFRWNLDHLPRLR